MTKLQETLALKPMNAFQIAAISMCVLLNIVDGFDILVMAFTAQHVSSEWGLSASELGALFSAGIIGIAIGSMIIAPQADKVGRRTIILLCLVISGIGMTLSGLSESAFQLGALRAITGLGVGGLLTCSNIIASEYASQKWKGLAVTILASGVALGATFGGMLAIVLIENFGWRSVFLFGGISTFVMIPMVIGLLPESLDFLLTRQPKDSLMRVNKLARRLDLEEVTALPQRSTEVSQKPKALFSGLIEGKWLKTSVCIWLAFFMTMFTFYFVMSWTPKLLATSGLSAKEGITGGLLLSAGGIIGSAAIGLLSARFTIVQVLASFMGLNAVLMFSFAFFSSVSSLAFLIGFFLGFTVYACMGGLYAAVAILYEPGLRATALGFATGIGRAGGILSPLIAGILIDWQFKSQTLFILYGFAMVLGCIAILTANRHSHAKSSVSSSPAETTANS
ncbi:MFS transporter [Pseudomonas rustica]